jgi:hypothetical protein
MAAERTSNLDAKTTSSRSVLASGSEKKKTRRGGLRVLRSNSEDSKSGLAPRMHKAETSSGKEVKKEVKVEKDDEVNTPWSNQPNKSPGSKQTKE